MLERFLKIWYIKNMKPHVRTAVVAVALSASLGKKISSVYSYSESSYTNIEISIKDDKVTGYDYTNSCHIDGRIPSLYHYGESSYLELKPKQSGKYTGYDYGSGCHFDITVRGNNADVYDYGSSANFSYST
jgi:hypothetical protein